MIELQAAKQRKQFVRDWTKSHIFNAESESGHIQRKESIFEDVPNIEQLQRQLPPRCVHLF